MLPLPSYHTINQLNDFRIFVSDALETRPACPVVPASLAVDGVQPVGEPASGPPRHSYCLRPWHRHRRQYYTGRPSFSFLYVACGLI